MKTKFTPFVPAKGPLQGKTVTLASQDHIERFLDSALWADFCEHILETHPLVTDGSHLSDFSETEAVYRQRVRSFYGVELPADRDMLYIWMILDRLEGKRAQ